MADMKASRGEEGEGKCSFDLEFRLKIHQDLFNRCICQPSGDTQSGLHNHILFGCIGVQVCVRMCIFSSPCTLIGVAALMENTKSVFITGVAMISESGKISTGLL